MFTLTVDKNLQLALIEETFARLFAQTMLHDYADGKSMTCAIFYRDELVGNCSLQEINPDLQKARLGYWLAENQQGKGIITRCVAKLIDVAFTRYQLEKAELAIANGNQPSQQVAKRLGFRQEGIITRAENLNGRIVDHVIYGLSRTSR